MHINLNNPANNFLLLSPLFEGSSPIISPLPNNVLRKYSEEHDEFMKFRLDSCANDQIMGLDNDDNIN
jgi:hypothetical protein